MSKRGLVIKYCTQFVMPYVFIGGIAMTAPCSTAPRGPQTYGVYPQGICQWGYRHDFIFLHDGLHGSSQDLKASLFDELE